MENKKKLNKMKNNTVEFLIKNEYGNAVQLVFKNMGFLKKIKLCLHVFGIKTTNQLFEAGVDLNLYMKNKQVRKFIKQLSIN